MIKLIWNSAAIKHSLTGTLLTLGLLMTGSSQASAATIGATLTADNIYGLYYGEADGSGLGLLAFGAFGAASQLIKRKRQ